MPTAIRPMGVAVSYMAQHIMIIILVQFTPEAIATISWKFFLIFVISSALFTVAFYFYYPETRLKTLEDLEAVFGDKLAETMKKAGENIQTDTRLGQLDDEIAKDIDDKAVTLHEEKIKA